MEDNIFGISSSPKLLPSPTTSRAASPNRRRPSKNFLKENVSMPTSSLTSITEIILYYIADSWPRLSIFISKKRI